MTNMNKKESVYTVGSEVHQTDGKLKTAVMASVAAAASESDDLKKDKFEAMKPQVLDVMAIFLAELLGTAILVFLGCMGCVDTLIGAPSHLQLCISFGMVVMMIIQIFGCVSGAHINPAVTVAAVIYDLLSVKMAGLYVVAQLIGAYIGYGLLKLVTPTLGDGFCVTAPHKDVSVTQAFLVEFAATVVLIGVCTGLWDPRNAKHGDSIPIKFGFTVAALAMVAGPYTGCSMNPARTFGPAVWNNSYVAHWVYWVAPVLAAVLTALTYKFVFRRELPKETSKDTPREGDFLLKASA